MRLKIWNIDIPPRTRLFLWRIAWNILPTKQRLRTKGVLINGMCYLWSSKGKCISHFFLSIAHILVMLFLFLSGFAIGDETGGVTHAGVKFASELGSEAAMSTRQELWKEKQLTDGKGNLKDLRLW